MTQGARQTLSLSSHVVMHVFVTTAPAMIPLGHAGELRKVASFHFNVIRLSGKRSDETFFKYVPLVFA